MAEAAVTDDDERDSKLDDLIPSFRFDHDVFLSFRGEDTRHTFTSRIYAALDKVGVRVFIDNEGLKGGDEIAPKLLEAIHDSAFAIAVISLNYAESRWCLEELATLVELRKLVMPVFYGVDPSDVRRQGGIFAEHFERHEKRERADRVGRWKAAMEKVGGISGWDSRIWEEEKLIKTIVKLVLQKMNNIPLGVATYPVGLASRVVDLMRMLDVNANGVKIVGLYGMGGIGKTTLAKAVYNKLVAHFKHRSFISNVRETWGQPGGERLLQKALSDDLHISLPANAADNSFVRWVTNYEKKVLVVLDDVDDVRQIHTLITDRRSLYTGSRVIIASRNELVLSGGITNEILEVTRLDDSDSLQLFSYHAFGRKRLPEAYMKLSKEIVHLAGGLPLALEVFGSFLRDKRRTEEWNDALEKLKRTCPGRLRDVLEISYNALDKEEKRIFLDIACFFGAMRMTKEYAVDIIRGCGFSAESALAVLVSRSLIKILDHGVIWMHDSLTEMGKDIVRGSHEDPGMRSRLWDQNEVLTVLRNKKGTRSIEGIVLEFGKKKLNNCEDAGGSTMKEMLKTALGCKEKVYKQNIVETKAFKHLESLRLLQINNVQLNGAFKYVPADIKWLQWKGCPLKEIPSELCANALDLSMGEMTKLWDGCSRKMAEKLMFLNLSECVHLTSIPDLSDHQRLEKLNLTKCLRLVKLHKSVGELGSLVELNLEGCKNLIELPTDVVGLKKLEKLILTRCSKLKELPKEIGSLTSLKELYADQTDLNKLPNSIFRLENLEKLTLTRCRLLKRLPEGVGLTSLEHLDLTGSGLEKLPVSIEGLVNLKVLHLDQCLSLTEIPPWIDKLTSLETLDFGGQSFAELPSSIGSLSHLKRLSISSCKMISTWPNSVGDLASLTHFRITGMMVKELPVQIGRLSTLEELHVVLCNLIEELPMSLGNMLNLTILNLCHATITELPESIGMMEQLHTLTLVDCKQLRKIPASVGKLKSLRYLRMKNNALIELREELGMLASLRVCMMSKLLSSEEPRSLMVKLIVVPKSFSNLSSLTELNLEGWKISGKIPDELEQLVKLETLKLDRNDISQLPASLRGLGILKYLSLSFCKNLKLLPPLPSSLIKLESSGCTQLESIPDLSEMEYLEELDLAFCEKVLEIPGLECLKSLKRLFLSGCELCFGTVRSKITKVTLRNLRMLSAPASEIPSWFANDIPCFRMYKHRNIKAVIIVVVISLDQQQRDDYRDKLPAVVDVQVKILRAGNPVPFYTTTLNLMGVPDTNNDQLYLCRYNELTPLVLNLKDGDTLRIGLRDKLYFSGLTLKKSGIHLVYEKDDEIGDGINEDWLEESERSISYKLANFFCSL